SAFVGDLTDEVDILNEEVAELEARLASERAQAVVGEQFVDEAAAWLISGTLRNQRVALITVHGVGPDTASAQRDRIVEAGADVVATIELTDLWFDADQAPFRSAMATQLSDSVRDVGADDGPTTVLAKALAQARAPAADAEQDPELIDSSQVLFDVLSDAELIQGAGAGDVDIVIVMVGDEPFDASQREDEARFVASL